MKQFDAVIFDMDGLLLDTEKIAYAVFVETCEHFGVPMQKEVFMRCVGTTYSSSKQVLKDGFQGKIDHVQFVQVWDNKYADRIAAGPVALKEGAAALLEHVASLNLPAAVATSTRTAKARRTLEMAGILSKFDAVVGGDQVENSKPQPDVYLRAAQLLKARPQACLALEDSENGVRAAVSAGMTVVQIPDLIPPSDSLRSLGHIVLGSLHDVVSYAF